jgi:hypothetical protein
MGWYQGEWVEDGHTLLEVKDWCPQCDPDGIPEPYTLRVCAIHLPDVTGSADVQARGADGAYWSSGHAEAGGEANAEWCRILHRS